MQTWLFYVCLQGVGKDRCSAWEDACEQFHLDPGETPENTTTVDGTANLECEFEKIGFTTPLACRHPDDEED